MTIEPGVSVEQLLHALQRKNIPLPYEMGTFIALECCERILGGTVRVSQADVFISDEGDVMVDAAGRASDEEEACRALVEMLGELLVRSAPGVPTMLLTLVEHGPSDGEWGLKRLRDDLEASLVPLNRAATRRVLARLLREIRRDRGALRPGGAPAQRELNQEIDSVLGGTPELASETEPGTRAAPAGGDEEGEAVDVVSEASWDDAGEDGEPDDDDEATLPRVALDEPIAIDDGDRSGAGERGSAVASGVGGHAASRRGAEEGPHLDLRPSDVVGGVRDLERIDDGARGRVGLGIGAALLVLSVLMVGTYVGLGREGVRRILGMKGEPAAEAGDGTQEASPATPAPPAPPAKRYGELEVASTPARAQVLLYVGTAPVEITGLPVGVPHELVAVQDGRQPSRVVVPADAAWTEAGAELRYEVTLETQPATDGADDLGPTKLPRDMGGPTGAVGTVRVESKPPGARIYQLVGFTPDVRVSNLALEEATELIVYLKGHALEWVTVAPERFIESEGKLRATIDVPLQAAK